MLRAIGAGDAATSHSKNCLCFCAKPVRFG